MDAFLAAMLLGAGYNTALVTVGSAILGAGAGAIGTFVLLRRRALISDAISHATLPGLALAFVAMALLGGDGRFMPGLLTGAALSAALGLVLVDWIRHNTRLAEDAAIGAVLSVFFGFGVVVLTYIQTLTTGGQAGLTGFLLGSTAGMLRSEAEMIAVASAALCVAIFVLRRPMVLVCFDETYAALRGVDVRRIDLVIMGLLLAITVIGLKVVGIVLIIALTIIPPVAARFWTNRPNAMVAIAALIGSVAAYLGAVVSALDAGLPTGALIVLFAFAIFLVSFLFSPVRGVLAGWLRRLRLRRRVHERQGLLAIAREEPIHEDLTRRILRRAGYLRKDDVPTTAGLAMAARVLRDERLWHLYRRAYPDDLTGIEDHGLVPIEAAVPPDVVADLLRRIEPRTVT